MIAGSKAVCAVGDVPLVAGSRECNRLLRGEFGAVARRSSASTIGHIALMIRAGLGRFGKLARLPAIGTDYEIDTEFSRSLGLLLRATCHGRRQPGRNSPGRVACLPARIADGQTVTRVR